MDKTYYSLNFRDFATIKKIEGITCTNYELVGDFVPIESLISIIYDLYEEYDAKCEELEDLRKDLEDNYKPIPYEDQI